MGMLPLTTFAMFFLLLVSPKATNARLLPSQTGEKFIEAFSWKKPPMFVWYFSPKHQEKEVEVAPPVLNGLEQQRELGVKFIKDFVDEPDRWLPKPPFVWTSSPKHQEKEVEVGPPVLKDLEQQRELGVKFIKDFVDEPDRWLPKPPFVWTSSPKNQEKNEVGNEKN